MVGPIHVFDEVFFPQIIIQILNSQLGFLRIITMYRLKYPVYHTYILLSFNIGKFVN